MSPSIIIAFATIVVVEDASPRDATAVSVPRTRGVVIDGTLDDAEWRGSAVVRRPEGDVLLRHDGRYLYVGVRTVGRGFPSVCYARGEVIRVAHASYALGDVVYTKNGTTWNLGAPFVWEKLAPASGPEADQWRARFLSEHGWVASTMPMGKPRHAEMQIALDQLDARDPRLGVAFFMEDEGRGEGIAAWPRGRRDDCANDRLVRGYAPERLTFKKKTWTRLNLGVNEERGPRKSQVRSRRSGAPNTASSVLVPRSPSV